MDIVGKTIQNGEPTPEHPVDIENKINLTGAIQILNKLKSKVTLVEVDDENNSEKEYRLPFLMNIEQQAIETVLEELENKQDDINILQAQRDSMEYQFKQAKAELEKKEAIINEMAEYMEQEMAEYQLDDIYSELYNCNGMERNWTRGKEAEINDIKEYFTKKAEEK